MPGPFGDLLFKRRVRQDQGCVGFLKLFRGDLQLLQGDPKFLVDDAEFAFQTRDRARRGFRGGNLGFEQLAIGLSQHLTHMRVFSQCLGFFQLELAVLLDQCLDFAVGSLQGSLELLVFLPTE